MTEKDLEVSTTVLDRCFAAHQQKTSLPIFLVFFYGNIQVTVKIKCPVFDLSLLAYHGIVTYFV